MVALRNPDPMWKIACCADEALLDLLTEHGLHAPETGGPTHKGEGDYNCTPARWLWWETTTPRISPTGVQPECEEPKTRELVIELVYPVCTENIDPCGANNSCCGDDEDCDGGCPEPDPKLMTGATLCEGETKPTVSEESAYIWRARYVMETKLGPAIRCCVQECAGLRCDGVSFVSMTQATEGAASFLQLRLGVTW